MLKVREVSTVCMYTLETFLKSIIRISTREKIYIYFLKGINYINWKYGIMSNIIEKKKLKAHKKMLNSDYFYKFSWLSLHSTNFCLPLLLENVDLRNSLQKRVCGSEILVKISLVLQKFFNCCFLQSLEVSHRIKLNISAFLSKETLTN